MHLAVYPPNGRIRIAAPLHIDDDAVRMFAISKIAWIKKQQAKFARQERQTAREYITGESHYFQGRRYLLNIVHTTGRPAVKICNKTYLDLYVQPDSTTQQRERQLTEWYRRQLKAIIPDLVEKWQKIIGVEIAAWGVKKMKTKWGTCNHETRRIWLNLELAKKSRRCLEYIIVHELVHLLERRHNETFIAYMDQFMPNWRLHKEELNRAPLGHVEWGY